MTKKTSAYEGHSQKFLMDFIGLWTKPCVAENHRVSVRTAIQILTFVVRIGEGMPRATTEGR